ncbi:MAG: adenosyl-hopene transferase HpnH [Bdellovibrionota bacterium]
MRTPIRLQANMTAHILREKLKGNKRIPLVLMLEPLHACNLTCEGCGRIVEYAETITEQMSLDECLGSAKECNAPVVSVCGGEPLIYRDIDGLIDGLVDQGKYIYLCTNAMFLDRFLPRHKPTEQLSITVHLDGLKETHDRIVEREGVFDLAIENIKLAKKMGYHVTTNTTIFKQTDLTEIDRLFQYLTQLGVDGFLLSPAYSYESLGTDPFMFHTKEQIHDKFRPFIAHCQQRKFRLLSSPGYLEFLAGLRNYPCAPWGNVTRNPQGWKGPCYAITNDHYKSYQELLDSTDWDYYAEQKDARCRNCKMHSGFEASVVFNMTIQDVAQTIRWQLAG